MKSTRAKKRLFGRKCYNSRADPCSYSEEAVKKAEANNGPRVYCAMAKSGHHVSVFDLEKKDQPVPPPATAPMKEQMAHRLKTPEGKALYKQRKQTVEPVFGVIKEVLGFRRFSMRGKQKAETEWCLVCLSYNLKKIFTLSEGCAPKCLAAGTKQHVYGLLKPFRAIFGLPLGFRGIVGSIIRNWLRVGVLTPTDC